MLREAQGPVSGATMIPRELTARRFTCVGFPLKIVGGPGGPLRAVAVLDD